MLPFFNCVRPNRPLESLIREWISEQPAGNEANLNEAKTRILEARSEKSKTLDLAGLGLFTLPPLEKLASHLEILNLENNQLNALADSIGGLSNLQELTLYGNQLEKLPNSIGELSNLKRLLLYRNQLKELPNSIGGLSNLQALLLFSNQLKELPNSIGDLNNLRELDLGYNQLKELPNSIGGLSNLQELYLSENQLKELPNSIGGLSNLQQLYLSKNQLEELPNSIGGLSNLRELDLTFNQLTELPDSIIRNGALRILPPQIDISNQSIPAPFIFNTIKAFSTIRANAQFTDQEKSQKATEALKIDYLETNNSGQNLKSKLREIKNSLITPPSERHIEPLTEFLKKFVSEDSSYNRADANSKELLSRQILEVLLIVNDIKDDKEFINCVLGFCLEAQESCADRTALYFYYLKNFTGGKTTSELDSMFQQFQHEDSRSASASTRDSELQDPEKLIEYLKNQATFNYILKMAESKCEEIKKGTPVMEGNPGFSEDVEVYLNYLRIFNQNLLVEGINSGLPAIHHQMYYADSFQPTQEDIDSLKNVLKSEDKSQIATFVAQNIRDETSTNMYHALDETKIYKTINLAVCDIASPYMDTDSYEKSQDAVKALETLQKLQKEIVKDEFEEVLLRIIEKQKFKINFDENKTSKIKEKIESTLRKEGLLPKGSVSTTSVAKRVNILSK